MRGVATGFYACALATIAALAVGHFALPFWLHWTPQMGSASAMMKWALPLLNFDWSTLTLAFTLVLAVFLVRPHEDPGPKRLASNAFAAYWVVHAAYLLATPIPIPARLAGITVAIQIFPIAVALMLLFGNVVFRPKRTD